ncbi:hypothetical protein Syun_008975 [Stephania yunnanensis]|uniref:Uncharacterized protein n=1 Tax=Stephania yunnanensis TaxID=152371 RepID=A0AAP0KDI7_9MAGN
MVARVYTEIYIVGPIGKLFLRSCTLELGNILNLKSWWIRTHTRCNVQYQIFHTCLGRRSLGTSQRDCVTVTELLRRDRSLARENFRHSDLSLIVALPKNSDNGRCDSYTPMIDIFDEAGIASSMKYVFQHMQELTLEVDVVTYIHLALLHWFSKNGNFEEMRINEFSYLNCIDEISF